MSSSIVILTITADRLSTIDEQFAKQQAPTHSGNIEERLLAYQRKIESETSKKYRDDFDRWKKLEIEMIKLAEREKQDTELQQRKQQVCDDTLKYVENLACETF